MRGTASSGAPELLAATLSCSRRRAGSVVNNTSASPLATSPRVDAACAKPGEAVVAILSTTSNEIISPAIFAKRLTRTRICTPARRRRCLAEGSDGMGIRRVGWIMIRIFGNNRSG